MTPSAVLVAAGLAVVTSLGDLPTPDARVAIAKALPRVEQGLTNYPKHRNCFSCHHHAVGVTSLTAAMSRGFAVDAEVVPKAVEFSLKTFRNKAVIAKGQGVGGDSTGVGYVLFMFDTIDRPYDDTTTALVDYLLAKQRKDGTWPIAAFGDRPPTMGSLFTNSGLAIGALKRHGPPKDAKGAEERQKKIDDAIAKGREWLIANKPVSTEDKVFHLRGLVDAGTEAKDIEAARDGLLKDQRDDGSWAQLANMSGDAYATATALVALRYAGLPPAHDGYQRGVKYLLRTQREDGAWLVQTRTKPLQVYFDNGDVGGKSQFISFAATNWAILALLETLPPSSGGHEVAHNR
jgi:N-acyl-D-amino-acid deacylase